MTLFPDIVAEVAPAVATDPPHAKTYFQVWSWYAPGSYWKAWGREQFIVREAAEKFGRDLPRGHTHYVVVTISLPGVTT